MRQAIQISEISGHHEEEQHTTNLIKALESPSEMLIPRGSRTPPGHGLMVPKQQDFQFGNPLFVHTEPQRFAACVYSASAVSQASNVNNGFHQLWKGCYH